MEFKFFRFQKIVGVGYKARAAAEGRHLDVKSHFFGHKIKKTRICPIWTKISKTNYYTTITSNKQELQPLPERPRMGTTANQPDFRIILGSQSMARKKLLGEMGYEFTIMTADIDEQSIRREKPEDLVMTLAEAKADAILSRLDNTKQFVEDPHTTLLITGDTVVVYEGVIREKPLNKEEAREFIKGYSGYHGGVVGSVLVTNLKTGTRKGSWDKAEVYFHEIPEEVIEDLVADSITYKVAGGLMIEHPLIVPFVDRVVGGVDTVMGLPKALTQRLIQEAL